MSAPDPADADDLVSGCVAFLRAQNLVRVPFANPADPGDVFISDARPADAELAGNLACVVSWLGESGSGNPGNTFSAQRLQIELWYAPGPVPSTEVGHGRILLFRGGLTVDTVLHRPYAEEQWWGTVRTTYCLRLAGMSPYEVPDSGGMWRGTALYEVGLG